MLLGGSHGESESDSEERAHFGANDIGWQAFGPAIVCTFFATTFVAARWFARHRLAQCLGLDDYVILLSLTLSWVMTALIGAEVNGGMGVFAGPVEASTIAQLVVASNAVWVLIVHITKASILLQYLRIFSSQTIRATCFLFSFLLVPAASWAIFAGIFLCSPIEKLWRPEVSGHCMDARTYWLSVAGIDIGLDFLILLLPLPAIANLRLPRKQKLGLLLVFTLGFFVCLVSVVRLLTVMITASKGRYVDSGIWAIIWSAVEANVGIICASLLSLKPLFVKVFPFMLEERRPARHSMRIAMIDACDIWRDETVKVLPRSASSLRTPSSSQGEGSWDYGRYSSVRKYSLPQLSRLEHVDVVEPEYPQPCWRKEDLNLCNILQENEEQDASARPQRKNSCFVEHL